MRCMTRRVWIQFKGGVNEILNFLFSGAFDVLVYTDKDEGIPLDWEESDPHFIALSQEVRLKSFSTGVHKVDTMVAYKTDL